MQGVKLDMTDEGSRKERGKKNREATLLNVNVVFIWVLLEATKYFKSKWPKAQLLLKLISFYCRSFLTLFTYWHSWRFQKQLKAAVCSKFPLKSSGKVGWSLSLERETSPVCLFITNFNHQLLALFVFAAVGHEQLYQIRVHRNTELALPNPSNSLSS